MKNKAIAIVLSLVLAAVPVAQILAEDMIIESVACDGAATEPDEAMMDEMESGETEETASEEATTLEEMPVELKDSEDEAMEADWCEAAYQEPESSASSEITDAGEGSLGDTLNLDTEIVLSVEEVADYASEAETEVLTDTVEGEVIQSGLSTNAAPSLLRTFSETTFDGSYGNQLEGTAKTVYDAMVSKYVNGGTAGEITIVFSEPVTFQTLGTPNGSGGLIWSSSENAEYQQKISYSMQAAYDAFIYDYPQIFWMNTFSYKTSVSFTQGSGSYTGKVSQIVLIPIETYLGAAQETDAFNTALRCVYAEMGLDISTSKWELVHDIHDYLCTKLDYGDTSSTYAHSAAGAFLKGGSVVCEGYAKAFKILCNHYGIECVLVVGNAEGGHMWNYVRMEDNNWYLVDTTWDDQDYGIEDTYLLAGSGTIGFDGVTIAEERSVYTNFSGAIYTNYFAVPTLSEAAYIYETPEHTHTWQVKEEKEPTCQETGFCTSVCTGCQEESTVILDKAEHRYEDNCYIDNNDATCTQDGTRTLVCDFGCGTKGGKVVVQGSATGHSFVTYVSNKDACFSSNGTKTASCAHGCGATKTVTDSSARVKLNVSSLKLQKGQSTSAVKVTGLPSGVKVKSWKSSNTKIVKVSKKGKITAQSQKGTAKITVTIGNGSWTDSKKISVTVQSGVVKTTKLSVDKDSVTLKKGKKHTIVATRAPLTSGQVITYTSSNKKVATVSDKGVVTAKGAGTAKITVKSGSKKKTVTIKVPKTKTTQIKNLPTKLTLRVGKTKQLNPKLTPTNSDEKLYYKSSNTAVAKITVKGKITAKKAGKTTITVKSGSIIKKFELTVTKK